MQELLKNLASHNDIVIHAFGWVITIALAAGTLLYKGIWKRINQIAANQKTTDESLNQLIGAHNVMALRCGNHDNPPIIERRADPNRITIPNYSLEEDDD